MIKVQYRPQCVKHVIVLHHQFVQQNYNLEENQWGETASEAQSLRMTVFSQIAQAAVT